LAAVPGCILDDLDGVVIGAAKPAVKAQLAAVATTPIIYMPAEFRRLYGVRGREVGQGGQGLGHQAGLIHRNDHFDTFCR
jgi:hypothetical protein